MIYSKGKASTEGIWKIQDSSTIVWKITKTACTLKFSDDMFGKEAVLIKPQRDPPSILRINKDPKVMTEDELSSDEEEKQYHDHTKVRNISQDNYHKFTYDQINQIYADTSDEEPSTPQAPV